MADEKTVFFALTRKIESAKGRCDDARGELGNIYQDAEERGFNRRAMKDALRLKAMDDDKRNDYLSSLAQYCGWLDLWAQGDLFGGRPKTPPPGAPAGPSEPTPFQMGEAAFGAGAEASVNPFLIGGAQNEAWREGWTTAFAAARGVQNGAGDHAADDAAPPRRGRGRPRKAAGNGHAEAAP